MYQCISTNTTGIDNTWLTVRGIGYVWDNPDSTKKTNMFPFLEVAIETGLLNYLSVIAESRLLSYTWNHWFQFGNIALGARLTLPSTKVLRLRGYGMEMKWIYNNQQNIPSLGGFRQGGTGFAPEGYIVHGNNLQMKLIYDMDFISLYSHVPIKLGINAGVRIPLRKASYIAPQFLVNTGVSYCGLGFDVFAEYSLEAFYPSVRFKNIQNGFFTVEPRAFAGLGGDKKTEVFFLENPMYVSLGGRIRYENGVTLFACIPFLLSGNVGSAMTLADRKLLNNARTIGDPFYDEHNRGMTDPFDPWFAKWKLVGEVTVPISYKRTGSEMMRNFLLLKNRTEKQKIDLDERLQKFERENDSLTTDEIDKKRRLEEIQRRRDQINKPE